MYKERVTWEYLRRIGRETSSSGMTSIVYFFILREPEIDSATFERRYYRWVAWSFWQVLRQPSPLLTYWFRCKDEHYPETFNTMRQFYGLLGALTGRAEALRIFGLDKTLQQRLNAQLP